MKLFWTQFDNPHQSNRRLLECLGRNPPIVQASFCLMEMMSAAFEGRTNCLKWLQFSGWFSDMGDYCQICSMYIVSAEKPREPVVCPDVDLWWTLAYWISPWNKMLLYYERYLDRRNYFDQYVYLRIFYWVIYCVQALVWLCDFMSKLRDMIHKTTSFP